MANGYLTTHVLDTARGVPAEGLKIDLYRISPEGWDHVVTKVTNSDGVPSATFGNSRLGNTNCCFMRAIICRVSECR